MKTESAKKNLFSTYDHKLINREFAFQFINRDLLKYIALLFMTLGHWAVDIYKIFPVKPFFQFSVAAQFIAPPIFFFFIAEGYHYTGSKAKYAVRLLIFAIITQIPHSLTHPDGFTLYTLLLQWSVLMTLFLGLLSLMVIHCSRKLPLRLLTIAALMAVSWLLQAEWAISGIILMLLFDLLREKPLLRLAIYIPLVFVIMTVTAGYFPTLNIFLQYLLPMWIAGIVIIFLYNGKKGHFPKFSKYFFYIWYPIHLLLQWIF
ncbi:MAG: hypothetical protein J6X60_13225 [Ruminiclostridium sp.]|nr:hypothetical protein [Ruminiclostridium sp.]